MCGTKTRWRDFQRILPGTTRKDWAALLARDALRQAVKINHREFMNEISAVMYRFQPEGPRMDEWETEAAIIVSGLSGCRSTGDVCRLVALEFSRCGLSDNPDRYRDVASEVAGVAHKYRL